MWCFYVVFYLIIQSSFFLQNILASLRRITKDRTSLFIAHRLSTVVDADEILVISDHKISEKGTHQQLMSNPNSFYSYLWHKQHIVADEPVTDKGNVIT